MTDDEMIKAFLAKKSVTQVAPGLAFGVDKEADKEKRAQSRQRKEDAARQSMIEREGERYMESVREAAHMGGRSAAIEAMNRRRWSY